MCGMNEAGDQTTKSITNNCKMLKMLTVTDATLLQHCYGYDGAQHF